jgi:iron complex transport system substrate-binding protein
VHPVRASRVLATALFVVVVTACSASAPSASWQTGPTIAPSIAPTAEPTSAATPEPTPEPLFPVTVTDDEGTEVEIEAEPTSIVSLSPANTEILFALGVGDSVVATDSASDYPAEAVDLPDVADFAAVDVEQVVALEADLVLAAGLGFTPPDAIAQLRDLGIPVIVVYAPTVDAVSTDIELIGSAVGKFDEAVELTAAMAEDIDAISAAVADAGTPPRTYYEIGYTDATGQIFAPADESFVAEMVTLAGGEVITTGDPVSYEIPLEVLITTDPEIIILGVNPFYAPTAEQVAARPGWDVMTAVADGAIRQVQDTEITRPGPRLPIGLRNLALGIWPDADIPAVE